MTKPTVEDTLGDSLEDEAVKENEMDLDELLQRERKREKEGQIKAPGGPIVSPMVNEN